MTAGLFPDVADVLCDLTVPGFFPDAGHVGLETPVNLADVLPFGRFGCIGGSDDRLTDFSGIDVDVFAGSTPAAMLLAEQLRQFLTAPGGFTVHGVVLDGFVVNTRPRPSPYPTPGVFRAFTSYRAKARRQTS